MELAVLIRSRLDELGLDQRGLARAADVTESYISQLLSGKRRLPAPSRTDIYRKMSRYLRLPADELTRLSDLQQRERLKRTIGEQSKPLFESVRALILRKCTRRKAQQVAAIFDKAAFGELERLVTQKLLEAAKEIAARELENEKWLRSVMKNTGRSYRQMRVLVLEFLDTTAFQVSLENYAWLLDLLIDSWDIDLKTFELTITMNGRLAGGAVKRFGFTEIKPELPPSKGFREFMRNESLSGSATEDEIRLLERLEFKDRKPTAIFYYRELQNLRDPLNFEIRRKGKS